MGRLQPVTKTLNKKTAKTYKREKKKQSTATALLSRNTIFITKNKEENAPSFLQVDCGKKEGVSASRNEPNKHEYKKRNEGLPLHYEQASTKSTVAN